MEIAKALSKEVKLLILDEPTAALNDADSEHLLDLLHGLQAQGITSIIISHKLNEIEQIADSITIIRDGQTIETLDVKADGDHRGPDHQRAWSAATSTTASPTHTPARSARTLLRDPRTGPCTTRSTSSARSSTRSTSPCGAARSSASPA